MILLDVQGLSKDFGGLAALDNFDIKVEQGKIHGLIGPNGAGKSTFFSVVTSFLKPTSGKVFFKGEDITGLSPHKIARKGLVRTFQATTLFRTLSVMDNITMGLHPRWKSGWLSTILDTPSAKRDNDRIRSEALEILEALELTGLGGEIASNLSHGHARALGIALALASHPELLLLDEPTTGMNPEETTRMVRILKGIRDQQKGTLMIIEHDMKAIMSVSDKITVLNYGKKIAEGLPEEIRENPAVIEAYLGAEGETA